MRLENNLLEKIQERVSQGYVSVREHPKDTLFIYNYTTNTQIEAKWDEATMMCRGLVLDHRNNIVARPFTKFFNVGEIPVIRNRTKHLYGMKYQEFLGRIHAEPFKAYPKMDGSLGVVFFSPMQGRWDIATRGSFASPQAYKGREMLRDYDEILEGCDTECTYLVEIIYPENRIVLDYGDTEELRLLAVTENWDGQDRWDLFEKAKKAGWNSIEPLEGANYLSQLETLDQPENEEGYVLVYPTLKNFRMKFKFDEYCRLHKIMTGVTPKRVWEQLRHNQDLNKWLDKVPDEFYTYVMDMANGFQAEYDAIEAEAKAKYLEVTKHKGNRKAIAQRMTNYKYRNLVFMIIDGKDYSEAIWKMVKPQADKEN